MQNCHDSCGAKHRVAVRATPGVARSRPGWPTRLSGLLCGAAVIRPAGFATAALLALGACTAPVTTAPDQATGFVAELPEQVLALAAPYQDLRAVRLMPADGCYWYRHVGPVEDTMLPLRTVDGRPICTGSASAASAAG